MRQKADVNHESEDTPPTKPASIESVCKATNTVRPTATSLDFLLGPRDREGPVATFNDAIVAHLRNKPVRICELLNLRDFDPAHWSDLYAEDFCGFIGTPADGILEGREACVQFFENYTRVHPSYRSDVADTSVQVDLREGTASVWTNIVITGNPVTVRRANITHLRFRRQSDGRWRVVQQEGIRGLGGFAV